MNIVNFFIDLLFPPRCFICRELIPHRFVERGICDRCCLEIPWIRDGCCYCGLPLMECCCSNNKIKNYDGVCVLGKYKGKWRKALHRFKFNGEVSLARPLGYLMERKIVQLSWASLINLIVPIPLHPMRLKERGYNQSVLLAREISRRIDIPYRSIMVRKRNTLPQAKLRRPERWQNIKGAFHLCEPLPTGAKVLLIDDIMTTGATVEEAAMLLKKGGASVVFVAVAAR